MTDANVVADSRARDAVAEVEAALEARDISRARSVAQDALAQGLLHPVLLKVRAGHAQALGRAEEAVALLRQVLGTAPGDVDAAEWLGGLLVQLGRPSEAATALRQAVAADPSRAAGHYGLGWVLEQTGELEAARGAHQTALALDPSHVRARASLASIAARAGDLPAARDLAEHVLAAEPMQPTATVALAIADLATGEHAAAEARLRTLLSQAGGLSAHARSVALGLLGDALDGLNRPRDAFMAYAAENELVRGLHAPRFGQGESAAALTRAMLVRFNATAPAAWRAGAGGSPHSGAPTAHVFLVGFPRSGTTLLEQILASHPDIVTLQEREVLQGVAHRFLDDAEGMGRLAELGANEADAERRAYWAAVRALGAEPSGRVFVDKLPLNTLKLPLIAKLFPEAKVLFALRDPRDVVLSCFRRHFDMNPAMYALLTLEGAADFYDAVMGAGLAYREALPLRWHEHRYEHLVADFDAATRALAEFLEVEWDAAFRAFDQTARAQEIRSPSAAQVRRGLYSGAGQWRRYEPQLASVLPVLQPWVERFGYAE